ncbi:MAG TPA: hypothetical protein VLC71_03955 [Thermomonas sp.]|nr:hypothetical protein [Thermomonas sp.]
MLDLRRFRRLAAVHWAEHGRGYLWFLGIGIAVHACVWLLMTAGGAHAERYDDGDQTLLFVAGYLLSGLLFAGRYHAALARPESALTFLMRPASALEKALLAFLVVAVLYPLAYTLAFQVCNLPGALIGEAARDVALASTNAAESSGYLEHRAYGPFFPFTSDMSPWFELDLFLGAAALQALVLAGALYFQRVAWLKTLVALFVLVVVAIPLLATLTDASPGQLFWTQSRAGPTPGLLAWKWTLWLGVPALFWASTYFLLRERELQ